MTVMDYGRVIRCSNKDGVKRDWDGCTKWMIGWFLLLTKPERHDSEPVLEDC